MQKQTYTGSLNIHNPKYIKKEDVLVLPTCRIWDFAEFLNDHTDQWSHPRGRLWPSVSDAIRISEKAQVTICVSLRDSKIRKKDMWWRCWISTFPCPSLIKYLICFSGRALHASHTWALKCIPPPLSFIAIFSCLPNCFTPLPCILPPSWASFYLLCVVSGF